MYEFECKCGYSTECLVSVDNRDTIRIPCPKCPNKRMSRVLTVANFGKPKHETKVILDNGAKVSGTWEK
jgi:hypothetical protein